MFIRVLWLFWGPDVLFWGTDEFPFQPFGVAFSLCRSAQNTTLNGPRTSVFGFEQRNKLSRTLSRGLGTEKRWSN